MEKKTETRLEKLQRLIKEEKQKLKKEEDAELKNNGLLINQYFNNGERIGSETLKKILDDATKNQIFMNSVAANLKAEKGQV